MLCDRVYCKWLLEQDFFEEKFPYLFNRCLEWNPVEYFLKQNKFSENFLDNYKYFNLVSPEDLEINLTDIEMICYKFYLEQIDILKNKILERIILQKDNPYDITAPTKWLKNFEKDTGIPRDDFKIFIGTYELPNITTILEDIKKQGGLEYKGAKSYLIAKENSKIQEKFWEDLLKYKYDEDISCQYVYKKCIFDFLNIKTNTIYECKINIKDYNESQHEKYLLALEKYKIIYLVGENCVIDIKDKKMYTTNQIEYLLYQCKTSVSSKLNKLDLMLNEFEIIEVENLNNIL